MNIQWRPWDRTWGPPYWDGKEWWIFDQKKGVWFRLTESTYSPRKGNDHESEQ